MNPSLSLFGKPLTAVPSKAQEEAEETGAKKENQLAHLNQPLYDKAIQTLKLKYLYCCDFIIMLLKQASVAKKW